MPGRLVAGEGTGGLEAVEIGHHHVHQNQVGQLGPGGFDPGGAIGGGQDLVPELLDDALYPQQLRR